MQLRPRSQVAPGIRTKQRSFGVAVVVGVFSKSSSHSGRRASAAGTRSVGPIVVMRRSPAAMIRSSFALVAAQILD